VGRLTPTLFTIGYEQDTQPVVVSALRDAGVEVLANIRYLPLSRRCFLPDLTL